MAKKYPFMSYIPSEMPLRKREPRCSSREDWKRIVQNLTKRYSKRLSKREGRDQLDFGGPMLKRRTDAILDSVDEAYRRYSDLLDCFPDYLALGEHIYHSRSGELKNIFFAESTDDVMDYAENICKGLETGLFRFVAHPDLLFINDLPIDENTEAACSMIIECASKNHVILEYNANGYRREKHLYPDGLRHPYPHPFFWNKVAKTDIQVIVGSDCHTPEQLYDSSVESARESALQLGLKLTDSLFY